MRRYFRVLLRLSGSRRGAQGVVQAVWPGVGFRHGHVHRQHFQRADGGAPETAPFTVAAASAQTAAPQPPAQEKPQVRLSPSMKISEILEKYPHLEEPMAEEGLGGVVNPAARQTAATIVTLAMAAKKAGKDMGPLIARLEGKKLISSADKPANKPLDGGVKGRIIKRGEAATLDTLIGYMLEAYPETKSVLEKHYGAACFTCAGQKTETIEQTASILGSSAQKILDEINEVIKG